MITLFEQNTKNMNRQSSKGNQLKWKSGNVWYKADYMGYEGLAEYVISHLLNRSTMSKEDYVEYDLEIISYKSQYYTGCKSNHFLQDDWQIITLERLFHHYYGKSLYESIFHIRDLRQRLLFLVNEVEKITGLKDFGKYINKLFTIDALFLNEDRHMHNIAVLMNRHGNFKYCPIFDNGAGLLADSRMDYPFHIPTEQLIPQVEAKSISSNFDNQLDISEAEYGLNLHFSFTENDLTSLLSHASDFYSEKEIQRVKEIILLQKRKYAYLFNN